MASRERRNCGENIKSDHFFFHGEFEERIKSCTSFDSSNGVPYNSSWPARKDTCKQQNGYTVCRYYLEVQRNTYVKM